MILKKLETFMDEVRAGKREASVVTSHTTGSLSADAKEAWRRLRKELESVGITPTLFDQHRESIIERIQKAMSDGELVEHIDENVSDTTRSIHSTRSLQSINDTAHQGVTVLVQESVQAVTNDVAQQENAELFTESVQRQADDTAQPGNMALVREPVETVVSVAEQRKNTRPVQGLVHRGTNVVSVDDFFQTPLSSSASVLPSLPLRLLGYINGDFVVFNPRDPAFMVGHFDIITYTWGQLTPPYNCGISGVDWEVTISREKLEDVKRLMISSGAQYMWVDSLCINISDKKEMTLEIVKIDRYYRSARMCYILLDMDEVWNPQDIVDDLKFLDHVLSRMNGIELASEVGLSKNVVERLSLWAVDTWKFPIDQSTVRSASIDMGVLNIYATCISRVMSVFNSMYFSRVWTFQEMLLGRNITLWGTNHTNISCIGELDKWSDLVTDATDKAYKLQSWITSPRIINILNTASVSSILRVIEEDRLLLVGLRTEIMGIMSARTDIINGGPSWWQENYKGVSNVFSVISIRPRACPTRRDIFRGLLGVFSGLFTAEEVEREMSGDDIEKISFAFFKRLSIKTGRAWTKLAVSSGEREEWDWIPVVPNYSTYLTTDFFAGVVTLGRLKQNGLVEATAITGINHSPRKYMKIVLREENRGFRFEFQGCNCGKEVKIGVFSSEPIRTQLQPSDVAGNETGRILVQCATILGSIMDPGCDLVQFRRRLLRKLQPHWHVSDASAKPAEWEDRCVSGTGWETPDPLHFKVHNRSMNYRMGEIYDCGSRLQNERTANISCEVRVNCGCTIVAPFSLVFEAITAVEGSFLGVASASLDEDNRICLTDGLGLLQVGDVGKSFELVAFGGDVDSYKAYAQSCRSTTITRPAIPKLPWPVGRALVREGFSPASKGLKGLMKDYGYVETGGSGNLLICRRNRADYYKIIGVCIDEYIKNKGGLHSVTIR
jgi:Heterokaryon incompatibility protein (HET)